MEGRAFRGDARCHVTHRTAPQAHLPGPRPPAAPAWGRRGRPGNTPACCAAAPPPPARSRTTAHTRPRRLQNTPDTRDVPTPGNPPFGYRFSVLWRQIKSVIRTLNWAGLALSSLPCSHWSKVLSMAHFIKGRNSEFMKSPRFGFLLSLSWWLLELKNSNTSFICHSSNVSDISLLSNLLTAWRRGNTKHPWEWQRNAAAINTKHVNPKPPLATGCTSRTYREKLLLMFLVKSSFH